MFKIMIKRHFLKLYFLALFLSPNINAATVSCDFISGEAYDMSSGAWIGSAGFEDIWDIFGDGISLPMENSLLSNLDSQEIFKAGETDKGTVYLGGGDMGVEGRLSTIEGNILIVYSGFCTIGGG